MSAFPELEWRRQPPFITSIDARNPFCRGLVTAAYPLGGQFYECVTGQLSKGTGTVKPGTTTDGTGVANRIVEPGTTSSLANPTGADSITGAWTVFAEASPEVNAYGRNPVFASTESNNGDGFCVGFDDATTQFNSMVAENSYNPAQSSLVSCLGNDSELYTHRVAWAWDTANLFFYAKGALAASPAYTDAITPNANRRNYFLTSVAGVTAASSAALILVWNRTLSLAEYLSLYANPWQVFAPLDQMIWTPGVEGLGGGASAFPTNLYAQMRRSR